MEEILSKLRFYDEIFPRGALLEAVNMKEEITEPLLEELDKLIESPEMATQDDDYMLHVYAIYLLAQFREKRAFKRVIDLISFTPEDVETLLGDVVTEGLPSILYSTFDGNLVLLKSFIENPSLNIYARGAALDVYGKLYSDGLVNKEECIAYLRSLIYDHDYDKDTDLVTDIQALVIDRHIFEMLDDIQILYDQDRIDTDMCGKYDEFIDFMYAYKDEREHVKYIDDIIKEISWWASFEQTEDEAIKSKAQMEKLYEEIDREEKFLEEAVKRPKKIGRNDLCPCHSGKKYKKCCLAKESSIGPGPIKDYSESLEEQKKWLKYYPTQEAGENNKEIRIVDIFDKESIDIDRLVYLALRHRPVPMGIKRDHYRGDMVKISYLTKAYTKIESKCKKEGISSFAQYDDKYKIHYRSKEWIETFKNLIIKNDLEDKFQDILKSINDKMELF